MDRFAHVAEKIAARSSRTAKIALLAAYLRSLAPDDLGRAVRFASGSPFAAADRRKLSTGGAALRDALSRVCPWDAGIVRLCYREVGDAGETIGLLLTGLTRDEPLSLAGAEGVYEALAEARKTETKVAILADCFARYRPLTIRYLVKVLTGDLRIGLQKKMVEEALAQAAAVPLAQVRDAANKSGRIDHVAHAAVRGSLEQVAARLFHPMDFMLAKPLDELDSLGDPGGWLIEDKYDGIRAQAHLSGGEVRLYTRGLENATAAFPELAAWLRLLPGSAVIDGEIVGWRDGRILPFSLFQKRIARKRVPRAVMEEVPVALLAYDLLYRDGELLADRPIEQRRAALEQLLAGAPGNLLLSPWRSASTAPDVERLFDQARARGNEGLVLKRRGSLYEFGKRSGAWFKLKKPYATLDVVITAAEHGHGRRAQVLSDYTFAVRDGDRFLNVGKAYSGLTDEEIGELTRLLKSLSTNRFGRVYLVEPAVVLEVAFDGIQQSSRHKSGYALRFPRIVRWRHDKRPDQADTLERVRELFQRSLELPEGGANS